MTGIRDLTWMAPKIQDSRFLYYSPHFRRITQTRMRKKIILITTIKQMADFIIRKIVTLSARKICSHGFCLLPWIGPGALLVIFLSCGFCCDMFELRMFVLFCVAEVARHLSALPRVFRALSWKLLFFLLQLALWKLFLCWTILWAWGLACLFWS